MKCLLRRTGVEVLKLSRQWGSVLTWGGGVQRSCKSGSEMGEDSDCRALISVLLSLNQWPFHKDCEGPYLACCVTGEFDCPASNFGCVESNQYPQHAYFSKNTFWFLTPRVFDGQELTSCGGWSLPTFLGARPLSVSCSAWPLL